MKLNAMRLQLFSKTEYNYSITYLAGILPFSHFEGACFFTEIPPNITESPGMVLAQALLPLRERKLSRNDRSSSEQALTAFGD